MTLPQKALFINASIRENMTLWDEDPSRSPEEKDALIEAVLRKVGIWDALFARKNPKKEETSSESEVEDKDKDKDQDKVKAKDKGNDKDKDTEKDKEAEPVSLDSDLDPEERLSIGQQQLFCLARALFQRGSSQIVLMDEFTSSMDRETEMLVRRVVKEDLKEKTVVEVIHRLQHIMDFDLAVVVEGGRVVEVGHPAELLQKESGLLRELYQTMQG